MAGALRHLNRQTVLAPGLQLPLKPIALMPRRHAGRCLARVRGRGAGLN